MLDTIRQLLTNLSNLLKTAVILLLLTIALSVHAEPSNKEDHFKAGEHFLIVRFTKADHKHKINTFKEEFIKDPSKPQLIMFFNYGCYGCWLINKKFHAWQKENQKTIDVLLIPVAYNPQWESLSKLYYLNQQLKPTYSDELFFEQIHELRKPLWLEEEVVQFYSSKNMDQQNILQLYRSFNIAHKVEKAKVIADIYGASVTPNFVLNIKQHTYKINFTMVDSIETLFRVVKYLIHNKPE